MKKQMKRTEKLVMTCASMGEAMYEAARSRSKKDGLSFSAYIRFLIKSDLLGHYKRK